MGADVRGRKEQERVSIELSQSLVTFLSEELSVPSSRISATTRLLQDLGVDGDDGVELIQSYGLRFGVDLFGFEPARHFSPEAGGNPVIWVWWVITRRWPKSAPITLVDLEISLRCRRWVTPNA